jgi:large subunit ribosomal protein L18
MRIKTKEDRRDRIKFRIRKRVQGNEGRPRLTIYRSVAHIYVQVVDDMTGRTIASASSVEPAVKSRDRWARRRRAATSPAPRRSARPSPSG